MRIDKDEASAPGGARVSGQPGISVIIPHFSDLPRLDICLSALERQTWPRGDFEIVIGDNDSPEGLAAVTATVAGRAVVTTVTERGPGPARNGALALARGRILAFTDADTLPDENWLAEGVAALERDDLVGGRVDVLVEDPAAMTASEAFELVFAFDNESYVRRQGFSVTANLFSRREVYDRIGGFPSWIAMEDLEWCRRARAAGFTLGYAPDSFVGHPARRSWTDLSSKTLRSNIGMYDEMAARRAGRLRWLLKSLAMPFSALAHTPKVLRDRKLSGLGQRLKAIQGLYRVRLLRMTDGLRLFARG